MVNHHSNSSRLSRGYATAVTGAFFLSTTAIFIRYLTQTYQIPPLILAFWRDVFVIIFLFPILLIFRPKLLRITKKDCVYLIAYGFVLATFNALWTLSVALNGAAIATVLIYCSAGFTALLGWWLLKEQLHWSKIVAIILSLGGCTIVSGAINGSAWHSNLVGIFAGILGGLSYAIYSLMGRSASQRGLNPSTTLFYTFAFAMIFLFILNLLPGNFPPGKAMQFSDFIWLRNSWGGWGILFLLAAIPTVAGFGFYNYSLSYLPSSVANLIMTLEPAFTATTAYIFLGERFTGIQIIGSVITLTGVVFLRIYENILISKTKKSLLQDQAVPT
ncbi:MAG: EamA family transporter [Chloroflexi bacterium HGW-Chloroflexi-8]|nr:MAG: EamA family transporter [Chloroflexi bacterium HGW-Chloroflexi-8]